MSETVTNPPQKINDLYTLQPEFVPAGEGEAFPALLPSEEAALTDPNQPSMSWIILREVVETVVLSLVIFLLIRQVVQNYRIESHSMEPNFYEGQFILVNKLAYKLGQPDRGEVLVFHNPSDHNEDWIKRIIGLPGDTIEIHDGQVFINGKVLDQPFGPNPFPEGYLFGPQLVEPNHLFVMGDNRPNSRDSRYVGAIDESLVVGQAWLRVWPMNKFGLVAHYQLEPGVPATP